MLVKFRTRVSLYRNRRIVDCVSRCSFQPMGDMASDEQLTPVEPPALAMPLELPPEVMLHIAGCIRQGPNREAQFALHSLCLVNHAWNRVAVELLYQRPYLEGFRFDLFVRTVCPEKLPTKAHRALAGLVKELDLARLVHQSSKSITARLLRRTKAKLASFRAPRASFGINAWAPLSKCTTLTQLDLSVLSEQVSYNVMADAVCPLVHLIFLNMPRCAMPTGPEDSIVVKWPPRLEALRIAGAINDRLIRAFTRHATKFPSSLLSLSIAQSAFFDVSDLGPFLRALGHQLLALELSVMGRIVPGELNAVLDWCPGIVHLAIDIGMIDAGFGNVPPDWGPHRWSEAKPLESLVLLNHYLNHHFNLLQQGANPGPASDEFNLRPLASLIRRRFFGQLRCVVLEDWRGWVFTSEGEIQIDRVGREMKELRRQNDAERRWMVDQSDCLDELLKVVVVQQYDPGVFESSAWRRAAWHRDHRSRRSEEQKQRDT